MKSHKFLRGLAVVLAVSAVSACQGTDDGTPELRDHDGSDVQAYLDALPRASVVDIDVTGMPSFVTGDLGPLEVAGEPHEADLRAALAAIAPAFRASPEELVLRRAYVDNIGDQHFRLSQTKNGLPVIGGELVLHARNGKIYAANGRARTDLPAATEAEIDIADALSIARDSSDAADMTVEDHAPLAYLLGDKQLDLVFQVDVKGIQADGTPVHDTVLVNAVDGSIAQRMPHIHTAKNREMHNLNQGTSLPGPLSRTEGQAPVSDATVNNNYDKLGVVYDCYQQLFARDSYNGAGAKLISSVHYSNNYVNAFWNGTQMVYGDGDGSTASNLAHSMDVTAHELTHAVTSSESNLTYSGESGGLNEAMSDIFGNVCEWFRDGRVVSANTWIVGEDVWTPATPGDGLRYMNDPVRDGVSKDLWVSGVGSADVHYTSGIANLAFYLLSQGGTHPRGKTSVQVTGIGIEKAAQIFYRANRDILTASSNFAAAKTATEQAAGQLGYTAAEVASVTAAWQAVGVGGAVQPPTTTALTNNVALGSQSASAGGQKFYTLSVPAGQTSLTFQTTGGTGDADMYVQLGSAPSTSTYTCKSDGNTSAETCTINNPGAGTWYVLLNAYSAFSGVTIKGTYSGGGGGGNTLSDGVAVTVAGASGSSQNWTMTVPAGKTSLAVTTSGGTGDLDLYVKFGSAPTDSSYDCRPYQNGNAESCNFNNPAAGTWYVRVKGYSAFSGASLKGDYAPN